MSIPQRLRYAREAVGLSATQASERTSIGLSSLSEFENGRRAPKVHHLQALARIYHRSVDFLLGEGDVAADVVLWRKRPEQAGDVEARFLQLCRWYQHLEALCCEPTIARLPEPRTGTGGFDYDDARVLAEHVREDLRLGDHPAPALRRVLEERCHVKVFDLAFDPTGTAACARSDAFGAAVLLNAGNGRRRRAFDLAHELFHLLTWSRYRCAQGAQPVAVDPGELEEKLANCFAAALLMPERAFREALDAHRCDGTLSVGALIDVAREFDVSVEAAIWAAKRPLGFSSEQARSMIDRCTAHPDYTDGGRDDRATERPERFRALAIKALRRDQLSIGKFAEYLGISRAAALRIAEQDPVEDEAVPVASA